VGVDVQSAGVAQTQTTSMVSQLTAMQTSNSGVDLDQELTNLTTYQYAYQGAAKLITTASEMYDTLLSLVGAAGS
jgi:flagellar hook-associated protein 1 FlgK